MAGENPRRIYPEIFSLRSQPIQMLVYGRFKGITSHIAVPMASIGTVNSLWKGFLSTVFRKGFRLVF
jgi:hypothetical protein